MKFRAHTLKSLLDVYPYYRDQQQYVSMARQARDELEAMFARDAEARGERRRGGWDS
jgi:glutathione-regulated potassium-efflux system ancillary protein KefC